MTVFVIHKPQPRAGAYDVSSAVEFGEIEYVFEDTFIPYRDPKRAEEIAYQKLRQFNSDEDFLLWAGGDPVALIIASMVAGFATDGCIKVLRWDRVRDSMSKELLGGKYVPITLDI